MLTDATSRDRLFFQQQRALLGSAEKAEIEAATLFEDLRLRLEELDELAESVDLERDGADIRHRYSGEPHAWMQQQLGDHVRAARAGAERLQVAAEDLEQVADDAGLARVARIARGYLALAAEARRVAATHRPGADLAQVDWSRVDVIADGVRRLQAIDEAEQRDRTRLTLQDHDRQQAQLRAAGLGELAGRIEADPGIQAALQEMRTYVAA